MPVETVGVTASGWMKSTISMLLAACAPIENSTPFRRSVM